MKTDADLNQVKKVADLSRYPRPAQPMRQVSDQAIAAAQNQQARILQTNAPYSTVQNLGVGITVPATLLEANGFRKNYKLWNATGGIVYVKEGEQASLTDYSYQIPSGMMYEPFAPVYAGKITALAAVAGQVKVTELT